MYFKYLSAAFGSAMITSVYSASTTAAGNSGIGGRRSGLEHHLQSWPLMGIGGSVIFSTKRGSEKCDGSENQYFTSAVIGAVILSILAWIGAICFERPILTFFGADDSTIVRTYALSFLLLPVQHLLDPIISRRS